MVYYRLGKLMNVAGFDLPSPDTWRIDIQIEIDLLHRDIDPGFRQRLLERVQHAFKKTGSTEVDFRTFFSLLKSRDGFSELTEKYKRVAMTIMELRTDLIGEAEGSMQFTYTKVKSRGELFGGERNFLHQRFITEHGNDIKAILVKSKDKKKMLKEIAMYVIPEYIDNPKHDSNGDLVSGTIAEVTLVKVPWAKLNTKDFSLDNHPFYFDFHKELDEEMIIHNKCVNHETFTAEEKKRWGAERLKEGEGVGLFPAWAGVEFPHNQRDKTIGDGFIRTLKWKGSLRLFTEDDQVPLFEEIEVKEKDGTTHAERRWLVSPLLYKASEDENAHALGSLFFNARSKYRDILKKQGIDSVLASEYILPEYIVKELRERRVLGGKTILAPLVLYDGVDGNNNPKQSIDPTTQEPIISMNNASRPNLRVLGLLEDEYDHNKAIEEANQQGLAPPAPLIWEYFDVEEASKYENPDTAILKARKIAYKDPWNPVAIPIPHHGIDIFYLELAKEQKRHNQILTDIHDLEHDLLETIDKAEQSKINKQISELRKELPFKIEDFAEIDQKNLLKKGFVDKQGEWLKLVEWEEYLKDLDGKFKSTIRTLLDERFKEIMTFEEVLLGLNKPIFQIAKNYCTDPRTGKFSWKYRGHEHRFRRLQDCIIIAQTYPANIETVASIHRLLINRVYESTRENFFKEFNEKNVYPYSSKIEDRLPDLAIKIALDHFKMDKDSEYVKGLEAKKQLIEDNYARKNYEDLKDGVRIILKQYTGYIKAKYPFARLSNSPSPGFYYTETVNLGNQQENADLREDRANLEFYIKFLEYARLYLATDFPEGTGEIEDSKKQWAKKVITKKLSKRRVLTTTKATTLDVKDFEDQLLETLKELRKKTPDMNAIKTGLLEIAKSHYATIQSKNRWGHPDLLRGEGEPMDFIIDIMTVIKNDKDKAFGEKWQTYAERLIQYAKNVNDIAVPGAPEDLLHSYEFENTAIIKDMLWYLTLYYDIVPKDQVDAKEGHVLYYTIDQPATGKAYLNIHVDIQAHLTQKLEDYFKDINDAKQYLTEDLPESIKKISTDLKWSTPINADNVRTALRAIIADSESFSKRVESDEGHATLISIIEKELSRIRFKEYKVKTMLVKDKVKMDKQGGLSITLKRRKALNEHELETLKTLVIRQLKDSTSINATNIDVQFS